MFALLLGFFPKYCIAILFIWLLSCLVPFYILHLRREPHSLDFNPSWPGTTCRQPLNSRTALQVLFKLEHFIKLRRHRGIEKELWSWASGVQPVYTCFAIYKLCNLEEVANPVWASIFPDPQSQDDNTDCTGWDKTQKAHGLCWILSIPYHQPKILGLIISEVSRLIRFILNFSETWEEVFFVVQGFTLFIKSCNFLFLMIFQSLPWEIAFHLLQKRLCGKYNEILHLKWKCLEKARETFCLAGYSLFIAYQ